jgi:hypothetical protein
MNESRYVTNKEIAAQKMQPSRSIQYDGKKNGK